MSLGSTLTAVAFWLGTLLPVVYIPVVIAGLDSLARLTLFVGLLGLNVVALALGRDYPETRSREVSVSTSRSETDDPTGSR
ncbi:hypothetical protein [Natronobeatus ordinarius]|uniref:hypothetical protein n=1 Tax=Natronobeatus ordinarius TaxID=2963433 RepID=UPI0020CE09C4|nr:hypothetical protein [Natronobeatus ordinarius]